MKKNDWSIVYLAVFALFMISCTSDEIIGIPSGAMTGNTIVFGADIEWPSNDRTRSTSPDRVRKVSLLSDNGDEVLPCGMYVQDGITTNEDGMPLTRAASVNSVISFNVWATYTKSDDTSIPFFSDVEFVKGNGDIFSSQDIYYWPGSGTVDFVAVSNAPENNFTAKMSDDGTTLESFAYTVPADATQQKDILVAASMDVAGDKNSSVPLSFKHVMSAVHVKIGSVVKGEIRSITFKNVYNKANYLVDRGVWVVDKTSTGDFAVKMEGGKFVSSGSNASGTPVNTTDGTFMFIPQNPGDNAQMVIEFYDSSTGRLYSDDASKNPYKPALKGSIADDNWEMNKTVNYMLSIDESFTLSIEPVGKKLDAHYIIGYANVTVDGIDNWTISASTTDGSEVTILPEDEVNSLAKQGFWTDYEVDANGNILSTNDVKYKRKDGKSARGISSWSGVGNVTNRLFYIFIPENIGSTDREIKLTLKDADEGATASTTKVLLQKCPNWTAGGFGWEVVDDAEQGKYGFKWTRKVAYVFGFSYSSVFGQGDFGTNYTGSQVTGFINNVVAPYNGGNNITELGKTNNWISIVEFKKKSYKFIIELYAEMRQYIWLDYSKLNNITGAGSGTDGFANTMYLQSLGGSASSLALETAIQNTTKVKGEDIGMPAFDKVVSGDRYNNNTETGGESVEAESGNLNDLSGLLTYIQKKNRYFLNYTQTDAALTPHAYFKPEDIKWYLPAYGQFQYFTPDPNIAGDDRSHYWSSTAVDGAQQAYIGDGTPKDRDLEYRVIAVRKDEYGYGSVSVQINNSSLAGGENGNGNTWVQ